MPLFVAPGKAVSDGRRVISGGDVDSKITWKSICKNPSNKKLVESAKASIDRLIEKGIIVESDEMPIAPEQVEAEEVLDSITQTVPLQSTQDTVGRDEPKEAAKHDVSLRVGKDEEKAATEAAAVKLNERLEDVKGPPSGAQRSDESS